MKNSPFQLTSKQKTINTTAEGTSVEPTEMHNEIDEVKPIS